MMRKLRVGGLSSAIVVLAILLIVGAQAASAQALLYVPNTGSAPPSMGTFTINNATGALTSITLQTTNNGPYTVSVTPNSRFVYVGDSGGVIDAFSSSPNGALTAT